MRRGVALRERAKLLNKEQTVLNEHVCRDALATAGDDLVVYVIMTHDRVDRMQTLLDSMRTMANLDTTLVVISQDMFTRELDELIATVDFVCTVRIFYPGSLQLNPDRFPGVPDCFVE